MLDMLSREMWARADLRNEILGGIRNEAMVQPLRADVSVPQKHFAKCKEGLKGSRSERTEKANRSY